MKPLNLDNSPCSPMSSNCVIWQGPDIPCIKLCKGDTISDIVFKLATELCTIIETMNVSNFDLSCFNAVGCPPSNFQALIQYLIDEICRQNEIITTGSSSGSSSSCPDCVVSVAPCFVTGNQTSMQLVDYVNMIANKICTLITQITDLQNQINDLDTRVTILENTPPGTYTLPDIATGCLSTVIGSASAAINTVLEALVNDPAIGYCSLVQATGLPADINAAIAAQCITTSSPSLANPGDTMGSAYFGAWFPTPANLSESFTDLWLSVCDIYTYLSVNASTVVVAAGENITVVPTVVGTTTTYTIASVGLNSFVAELIINGSRQPANGSIPAITPSAQTGLPSSVVVTQYNSITSNNFNVTAAATPLTYVVNASVPSCPFGTFDNATTGKFTITEEGMYLVEASVYLKSDNTSTSYWQAAGTGSFGVGILVDTQQPLFGSFKAVTASVDKNVEIAGSAVVYLAASTVLSLGVLNTTSRSYVGNSYTNDDKIRFSITQIRL
jgi:hypothetical protein